MLDPRALVKKYQTYKERVMVLKRQIQRIKRAFDGISTAPTDEGKPTDTSKMVLRILDNWEKELLVLSLFIFQYESVLSELTPGERSLLRLHYEEGLSLRQLSCMDLTKYFINKNSLSTLRRLRKNVEKKLEIVENPEPPLFTGEFSEKFFDF